MSRVTIENPPKEARRLRRVLFYTQAFSLRLWIFPCAGYIVSKISKVEKERFAIFSFTGYTAALPLFLKIGMVRFSAVPTVPQLKGEKHA